MYIPLISVSAAAALIMVFIPLLRCAFFFSSFSELVLAPCGLLALFFSISPLALPPLLSVVVGYRPPSVSPPVLLGFHSLSFAHFPLSPCCRCSRSLLVIFLSLCRVLSLSRCCVRLRFLVTMRLLSPCPCCQCRGVGSVRVRRGRLHSLVTERQWQLAGCRRVATQEGHMQHTRWLPISPSAHHARFVSY
jgi:hypothetical protein